VTNPFYHIGPGRPTTSSQRKEVIPKKQKRTGGKEKGVKVRMTGTKKHENKLV